MVKFKNALQAHQLLTHLAAQKLQTIVVFSGDFDPKRSMFIQDSNVAVVDLPKHFHDDLQKLMLDENGLAQVNYFKQTLPVRRGWNFEITTSILCPTKIPDIYLLVVQVYIGSQAMGGFTNADTESFWLINGASVNLRATHRKNAKRV